MNFVRTFAGTAVFAGLLLSATGCELLTAPDRTKIDATGGTGGTTTVGGGGTTTVGGGGSGGTTTVGGGGTGGCTTPEDDMKECTDDVCNADGITTDHNPKTAGEACTEAGGKVCDGAGVCVECLDNANCTDPLLPVCAAATKTCVAPTCTDEDTNGAETDLNCGGPVCDPCADDLLCLVATDCESGVCKDDVGTLKCAAAACDDTVVNGDETDVDCGGSCAPALKCADTLACKVGGDCVSGVCKDDGSGALACAVPECGDMVVNDPSEVCDDGNMVNGDGCDNNCTVSGCGNGAIVAPEICDDGNTTSGDGCDANCKPTGCGSGIKTGAETCDDGNTAAGDGCDAACALEPGYTCDAAIPNVCATTCSDGVKAGAEACDDGDASSGDGCSATCTVEAGFTCTGSTPTTCAPICGDGLQVTGELCDQGSGNVANGDGCSSACIVEFGYTCTGTPSVCTTTCGDSKKAASEGCDDGGAIAGDGCSATCTVEAGFTCTGNAPSVCVTTCGDGIKAGAEACDQGGGNVANGDGCSATCTVEAGFTCTGTPSVCAPICGDGLKVGGEACDQGGGNVANGDGCSSTCTIEAGFTCPGTPSVCAGICGDNLIKGAETCDDGNTTNGDCCSSTCVIEPGCELEPNDACGQVTALPNFSGTPAVTTLKGNIKPVADLDFYTFTLPGPGVSAVRIETFFGTVGTCASTDANDTRVELRATNCTTILASNDDGAGIGYCSLLDGTTTAAAKGLAAGTYTVRVQASPLQTVPTQLIGYGLQVKILATCGNGTTEPTETCDDNNTTAGDGCSAACQTEAGYTCAGTPSVCTLNCGNGTLQAGETCDQGGGNVTPGDGCSATCQTEAGFTCSGTPSTCITIACGNGVIQPGETCDQGGGNVTPGDGCSATCAVEAGYTCIGTPSVCLLPEKNCSDGIDNNGGGGIDAADPTCALPAYFTACGVGQTLLVYPSTDTPLTILDNTPAGAVSTINVTETGTIVRAAVLVNIAHTFDGDVDLTLTSPGATAFDVSSDNGSSGDNYTATLFDSTCATAITAGAATPPYTGCFAPEATFAPLATTSATGAWQLKAVDDASGIAGVFNGWRLALCVTP